jgi:hypothetical protein
VPVQRLAQLEHARIRSSCIATSRAPSFVEVDVDGLPELWPVQAGATPQLTQSDTDALGYSGGGWQVFVERSSGREDMEFSPLPGTVLGHPHGFGLARRSADWRAIAVCGSFTVDISGVGEPPVRLDLEEVP